MSDTLGGATCAVFEESIRAKSFSMSGLLKRLIESRDEAFSSNLIPIFGTLGKRVGPYVVRSLIRNSFLIEYVGSRGGATKMDVRWSTSLTGDSRYCSFEECLEVFLQLLRELQPAIVDSHFQALLAAFHATRQVSYELPIDYMTRVLGERIHTVNNISWVWSDLPVRITRLRALLYSREVSLTTGNFSAVYDKISTKTYLTDRAQTGEYQTNREKRWEMSPLGQQFALRRDCWGVEYALINQLCHFRGFPAEVYELISHTGLLTDIEAPYRCPITLEPIDFEEFWDEIQNPQHGRSTFQVGHLNPLRSNPSTSNQTNGSLLVEGHTQANIGWISRDGNRIQGHLTLDETKRLLQRIARNYAEAGVG